MSCDICRVAVPKYKCPSCRIPYCSLACWKKHKSDPCEPKQTDEDSPNVSEARDQYNYPTADTVPLEKLQLLGGSERLKSILSNPHTRRILLSVNESTKPNEILQDAMQEPLFVEFVNECMRLLYPPSKEEIEEVFSDGE